jgi:hypothetical protein
VIARAIPSGPALRVTRLCMGRSQTFAAGHAEIPLSRYRRIEAGVDVPTPEEVARILGALSSAAWSDPRPRREAASAVAAGRHRAD